MLNTKYKFGNCQNIDFENLEKSSFHPFSITKFNENKARVNQEHGGVRPHLSIEIFQEEPTNLEHAGGEQSLPEITTQG